MVHHVPLRMTILITNPSVDLQRKTNDSPQKLPEQKMKNRCYVLITNVAFELQVQQKYYSTNRIVVGWFEYVFLYIQMLHD